MSTLKPYWQQRRDLKLAGPKPAGVKRKEKAAKGAYFANQVREAGQYCENCGADLRPTKAINPATIVAHIVSKSERQGCPSVALHPLNKWDACGDCHTNYDNKGAKFVQSMPIFQVLKDRVRAFYNEISPDERRRVPVYFRP